MRCQQPDSSQYLSDEARELPLSGQALLALMQDVLSRGVPFRFRARGWSMAPFLRDGDVVTVSPLRGVRPGVGAVVAFVQPNARVLVVHRVLARRGAVYVIRGDGVSASESEVVPLENLLGRVTRVARNGRPVRFGLGAERRVIAWLSRAGVLSPLRSRLRPLLRLVARR